MNINSINQMFNEKLQNINSRVPSNTTVNNKFQDLLKQTQLKNFNTSETTPTEPSSTTESTSTADVTSLLKTMLSTQSLLNTTLSDSNSSSLFPTSSMNNTITMLQQSQLLNALKNNTNSADE